MKSLLPLLALVALLSPAPTSAAAMDGVSPRDLVTEEWETWKLVHNKSYPADIEKATMNIFIRNWSKVIKHNRMTWQRRQQDYFLKMNEYADLPHSEFLNVMNGCNRPEWKTNLTAGVKYLPPGLKYAGPVPEMKNWRKEGAVTPVKNQGQCGSCWAFSATGALEGQHFITHRKLVSMSEQNLVDCSKSYGNDGCNGGQADNAFKYAKDNGGIDTEVSYPYKGSAGICRNCPDASGSQEAAYSSVPPGDEEALMLAVATVGPVSVAIDASHESFQFYSHGVYAEEACSSDNILGHAALVVGYGEESGKKYWLVKNSWGESWGEEGYIRIARDQNNMCGVASSASFPGLPLSPQQQLAN